ncbi:FUSC family protein [Marinibaculum pumilum]|uniref:FUSC family protein n=1 Tax=Marinibaculum pumilum TaxID=1766165 RepID=A0ABV7KU99_9PROT
MTGPAIWRRALPRPLAWLRDTLVAAYEPRTFFNGLRIVLLAAIPFFLGIMLHSATIGLFAALGAIWVGFCDLPGSYRRRAVGLLVTALLLGLSAAIGTLMHGMEVGSLAILFLLGTLLGFVGTLTATAGKATTFALLMLILGCGIGGAPLESVERGIAALVGGTWMTFGTLIAWPIQPFSPARRAVRQAFADLSRVLETAVDGLSVPRPEHIVQAQAGWQARAAAHASLDAAMGILTDLRAIRDGTSMTGRRLVLALQQGRLMALSVSGLSLSMQTIPAAAQPVLDPVVGGILRGLARDVTQLGAALGPNVETVPPAAMSCTAAEITARLAAARDQLSAEGVGDEARTDGIAFYLLNLRAEIDRAREALAGSIEAGDPDSASELRPVPLLQALLGADPAHVLWDNLALRSQRLRHGLRVGAILAIATFAYTFFGIDHGYWIPLVAVVVLKPGYGGTRAASIARTVGTVIGGVLAAIMLELFHGTLAHAILALVFAICAFGVISRNLGLGTVLLTPFVVMLLAILSPAQSDVIWLLRIGDTMIGAAMAFVGLLTLWPSSERERVPALAAGVLRCHVQTLRILLRRVEGEPVSVADIRSRRRAGTLAMSELDACWEQLLSEPREWHPQRDTYYTLVALVRLALVQAGPLFTVAPGGMSETVRRVADALAADVTALLEEVAASLDEGAPLPDIAVRTQGLRQDVRALEQQEAATGAGDADNAAGTALHLVTGCLARLAETAVNLAQVTERLQAGGDGREPPPRYQPPDAATAAPRLT